MASSSAPCLFLLLASRAVLGAGHDDHEGVFDWGGIFDVSVGQYAWYAARASGGRYAEESCSFVVLNASSVGADFAGLAGLEKDAEAVARQPSTSLSSGGQVQLNSSLRLLFDDSAWVSLFKLQISENMRVAVFAQHVPTEFESGFHFFKAASGEDIEALVEKVSGDEVVAPSSTVAQSNRWGLAVGGGFITTLPALLAVVWAVPLLQQMVAKMLTPMFAFASGAVFGAAVFLLLPEALHLIGEEQEEAQAAGSWGACILAGWFTALACHFLSMCKNAVSPEEPIGSQGIPSKIQMIRSSMPVLLGDWFHNFSDGLVIGVAAKGCSESFVWKLIGITIAHEFPQEVADCIVLINQAGMHWSMAAVLNWLFSASTPLGAAITYGADVGIFANGCILAFGAGVYLFVALTELGQRLTEPASARELLSRAVFFCVGATALGLILLDHHHCVVANSEENGPTGHSHSHR